VSAHEHYTGTLPAIITEAATFIGIDFHKKYSVYHAIDAAGVDLGKGRIEHHAPQDLDVALFFFPRTRSI
jgi:hypothetical protein